MQDVQTDVDKNYIIKYIPRTGSPVFAQGNVVSNQITISYYDDLGRPQQIIEVNASPSQKDVAQPIVYDPFGRDDAVVYQPYEAAAGGAFKSDWATAADNFHNQFYYSGTRIADLHQNPHYGVSALNRVQVKQGPGGEFREGGRAKRFGYNTNGSSELLWFSNSNGILHKRPLPGEDAL